MLDRIRTGIANGERCGKCYLILPCRNDGQAGPCDARENTQDALLGIAEMFRLMFHPPGKTHCRRGHEYTDGNTIWGTNGRQCRRCDNIQDQRRRDAAGYRKAA